MKTLLFLILIVAAVASITALTYTKPVATDITLLRDITEKHLAKPQADEILRLYNFSESKWNGVSFRFVDLSDVSYNRIQEIKIEIANEWLSNELEREKEIKNFQSGVAEIIDGAGREAIGKNHSSVYLPIARELDELSRSKSNKRVLLVYSDLMENTPDISFYDKKSFRLLQSNPDSLKNLFEKMQPLNSLNGIEVHLIFQPADTIQDKEFQTVSEFYREMLEEKGAQVTISANL